MTEAATLTVSIVLYLPDVPRLEKTLLTLRQAAVRATAAVPTRGRLERVLVHLVDHSPEPLAESSVALLRQLESPSCSFRYDRAGANPGFGAGHNRAFAASGQHSEFFLVANPDLEFFPDSLQAGIACLRDHPERGLLAPALVEDSGELRPACFRPPDVLTLLARWMGSDWARRRSYLYECRDWPAHEIRLDPPLVSGCCMLFRSPAFAALGGFDARYFLYFEDFDLSGRAHSQQLSIYWPAMRIRHHGGNTRRKPITHQLHYLRSAARYFGDHGVRR